jgi:hypothetical protein
LPALDRVALDGFMPVSFNKYPEDASLILTAQHFLQRADSSIALAVSTLNLRMTVKGT